MKALATCLKSDGDSSELGPLVTLMTAAVFDRRAHEFDFPRKIARVSAPDTFIEGRLGA
jgi:hypothetical protein